MIKNVFVGRLGLVVLVIVVLMTVVLVIVVVFFVPYRVAELSNLSGYKLRSLGRPSYGPTMIKNVFVGILGLVVLVIVVLVIVILVIVILVIVVLVIVAPYCIAELSNISGYKSLSLGRPSYGPTMTKNMFVGSLGLVALHCPCDCCCLLFFVPYRVAESSNLSGYKLRSLGRPSYGLTMIKNVFVGSLALVALHCRCDCYRLCCSSGLVRWSVNFL